MMKQAATHQTSRGIVVRDLGPLESGGFRTSAPFARLQQTVGNQAVVRAFSPSATVRRSCACGGSASGGGRCTSCDEEERLRRSSTDRSSAGHLAPQVVHDVLQSPGQPLAEHTRTRMESRLGRDFRDVRISSDDRSATAADAIHAKAFTYGNRVVFGRNEYAPHSPSGLRLLAHELAHTAQQGSGALSLQTSLKIGGVDDPQEREADLAADAVLYGGQSPSLSAGGSTIRRQPKGGPSWDWRGVNELIYTADGGSRYIITRSSEPVTTSEPTTAVPGVRFAAGFVTIKWCKHGVRGTVEAGVDITNQLQQLIPQMLATGNPAQVLRQANLTAYVDTVILPSEKGPVHFNIQADVGQQGVSAVRVGGEVETPIGRVGADIGAQDLQPGGRPFFSVDVRVTPGKKAPKVQCEWTTFKDKYQCRKEEKVSGFDFPLTFNLLEPDRVHYLYFDYARAKVTANDTEYGKKHPDVVARNNENLHKIMKDIEEEFRVSAIEGFTSPEGPLHREGKVTGEFKDNQDLSERRAKAALEHIATSGRCVITVEEACFFPNKKAIPLIPRGELFSTTGKGGKEAEGEELAKFAVPEFMKEEGSQLTESERKQLASKRGALAQADVVYPLLRRAKVTMRRSIVPKKIRLHVEGGWAPASGDCPQEVVEAAKKEFKKRDMGVGIGGL